ncbi:zinc-dependent alcohol dehydrogenase family protein [Microlunatus ginsengisoli]|uniref:Zinc-dependent alcohol dehydrogenase family protein n=1 Tax=Microlunatus ginsengisoli TaxID=363863 RepID=A0ABP6ZZ57_9ACTN
MPTMRAVVYKAAGRTPKVREVDRPEPPPGGVVIKVAATGVCRSDWHAWQGHEPVPLPHIPGHEFAGTVAAVGPKVKLAKVGDRVTAPFVCGCGRCDLCRRGDAQVCPQQTQPGFTHAGSFAEYVVVHAADTNLVPLPKGVPMTAAAALGCRFATAYRALVGHGRIEAGQTVAVFGCGGVGLSAVMIATALKARVIAVDVSARALDAAADLGAAETVRADASDPAAVIHDLTDSGAHLSIDAIGSPAIVAAAVRSLRRRGRHVQVGLLLGDDALTAVPMDRVISHELEIFGSHGMPAIDYPPMLELIARRKLQPDRLIGRTITLDEAPAALAEMSRPKPPAGLTVIDFARDGSDPAR